MINLWKKMENQLNVFNGIGPLTERSQARYSKLNLAQQYSSQID
jgi:hypothetical protein